MWLSHRQGVEKHDGSHTDRIDQVTPLQLSTATDDPGRELAPLLKPDVDLQGRARRGYFDLFDEARRGELHRDQGMFRFRALPPIYERLWRPLISRMIFGRRLDVLEEQRIVLSDLAVSEGGRVIDIGCGTGNYTRKLAQAAGDGIVVGVDASEAMISAAARRGGGSNLVYLRGDGCALPFLDGLFDAVCSVGVIHMVDDPMAMLDEMTRMLSPGGRLAVMATCEKTNVPRVRGQMTAFGREELTRGLAERGLIGVRQRVVSRGQFVSGQMPK